MNLARLSAALAVALLCAWDSPTWAQKAVYLVRHAETTGEALSSPLTTAGKRRAETLGRLLEKAGVKGIYTSDALRTQETAKPLAKKLGLTPVPVTGGDPAVIFRKITTDHPNDVVLVVGHSNTVPALMKKWDPSIDAAILLTEFDKLFVLVPIGTRKAGWTLFRYPVNGP